MANGQYPEPPVYGAAGASAHEPHGQPITRTTGRCGCHSTGTAHCSCHSSEGGTCCDLTCFERPKYFCGHLLTDADLSLDQRYVIEKQKLYHRALHGHGIVCGLRLTCDAVCCGHVRIGEGFGIDDCGHDLVVCEETSFDVLGRLREKKLLIPQPPPEDCEPPMTPEDCRIRQCFYVVACYQEEGHEYATPLTPGCGPSLSACEPTRVRETVTFDVVDELPRQWNPAEELKARIEHCFALFTQGPFAKEIKSDLVKEALAGDANSGRHKEFYEAFCRLRALLGFYLQTHPDKYNCRIADDIAAIKCPSYPGYKGDQTGEGEYGKPNQGNPTGGQQEGEPQKPSSAYGSSRDYGSDFRDAFCRLIEIAYNHVISCVLGELAFPCAEPAHASCLVLGTVVVEDDCVVRVCNCPRTYVWSFASLFQVLMATLFGPLACEQPNESAKYTNGTVDTSATRDPLTGHRQEPSVNGEHDDKTKAAPSCCAEFKPLDGCVAFVNQLREGGSSISDLGTKAFDVVNAATRAFRYALAPTRADALLLRSLRGQKVDIAMQRLEQQQIAFELVDAPEQDIPGNPIDELSAQLLLTRADPLVALQRNGVIVDVRQHALHDRVASLEHEIAILKAGQTGEQSKGGRGPRSRGKRGLP